jgi:hypothetical protein
MAKKKAEDKHMMPDMHKKMPKDMAKKTTKKK